MARDRGPAVGEPYAIVRADEQEDAYAGSDVPGEFRALTAALGGEQLAATLIRIPPHSDFEQGTGHYHEATEELYLVTRGTLTMRLGDDVHAVSAGSAVRVAPHTPRSHRNEGDEPVELWAVSRRSEESDAVKLDDFWEASPRASRTRGLSAPVRLRTPAGDDRDGPCAKRSTWSTTAPDWQDSSPRVR
jgi:quercetin dioxygenase-like cupin family protein